MKTKDYRTLLNYLAVVIIVLILDEIALSELFPLCANYIGLTDYVFGFLLLVVAFLVSWFILRNLLHAAGIFILIFAMLYFLQSISVTGCPNSFISICNPASGYMCQSILLHGNTLNISLGQTTGANWQNVNFIWVPDGTPAPPIGYSCPIPSSNTTAVGLTCATPNSISLVSGSITAETFTFSKPTVAGYIYSGQIWAIYQTNTGGSWYRSQLAELKLKSV